MAEALRELAVNGPGEIGGMRELIKCVARARIQTHYPCCGVSRSVAREYGHSPTCQRAQMQAAARARLAAIPEKGDLSPVLPRTRTCYCDGCGGRFDPVKCWLPQVHY